MLRHCVRGAGGIASQTGLGSHVHDRTATSRQHYREHSPAEFERASQVDPDDAVPHRIRRLVDGREVIVDAGHVCQSVDL